MTKRSGPRAVARVAAAILSEEHGARAIYMAGNAGNGANPQPAGVVVGTGAQILKPSREPVPELLQEPGFPTPVGSFNVTQLGDKIDKVGKDTNFRGLTTFNNVVYSTSSNRKRGAVTLEGSAWSPRPRFVPECGSVWRRGASQVWRGSFDSVRRSIIVGNC